MFFLYFGSAPISKDGSQKSVQFAKGGEAEWIGNKEYYTLRISFGTLKHTFLDLLKHGEAPIVVAGKCAAPFVNVSQSQDICETQIAGGVRIGRGEGDKPT